MKKRSKYRYFTELEWAEQFMDGSLLFRSLSYYHQIEDGKVRGDPNEGSVSFKPDGGLVIRNHTKGTTLHFPAGAFGSNVNPEEIFILCASNSMTDELRIGFSAKACVQILRKASFCERIRNQLPRTVKFHADRVTYYSPANALGPKWAPPRGCFFKKPRLCMAG
jgi:hypothetical protein